MTGKQLKEFAAQIYDDAVIEMREWRYESWKEEFSLRATIRHTFDWQDEKKKAALTETAEEETRG